MADRDRQVESLIREFKSNELEYEEQICSLATKNKILQIEVEELKTYIKIYGCEKQEERNDTNRVKQQREEIGKMFMQNLQGFIEGFLSTIDNKLDFLSAKTNKCKKDVQRIKQAKTYKNIEELKRQTKQKDEYIQAQGQLIDKIINQKSQSQGIYNRQIKFLEKLANEKKQLCNRLQEVNSYLMLQNTQLKQQEKRERKSSYCKTQPLYQRRQTQQSIKSQQSSCARPIKTKTDLKQQNKQQTNCQQSTKSQKYSTLNTSVNPSKTRISLHIDRKQFCSASKERQNTVPFSDIKNQFNDVHTYK